MRKLGQKMIKNAEIAERTLQTAQTWKKLPAAKIVPKNRANCANWANNWQTEQIEQNGQKNKQTEQTEEKKVQTPYTELKDWVNCKMEKKLRKTAKSAQKTANCESWEISRD